MLVNDFIKLHEDSGLIVDGEIIAEISAIYGALCLNRSTLKKDDVSKLIEWLKKWYGENA